MIELNQEPVSRRWLTVVTVCILLFGTAMVYGKLGVNSRANKIRHIVSRVGVGRRQVDLASRV